MDFDKNDPLYKQLIVASERLTKDLIKVAAMMDRAQVRFLVDDYYIFQRYRIATAHQLRSLAAGEPGGVLKWANKEMAKIERGIPHALQAFANEYRVGQWMMSIRGIGPILAAGLLAHLDVSKCQTAGHFWRFAGLDPTLEWKEKQKRPWNARLKSLAAFKLGQCFVWSQDKPGDYYGRLFRERRDKEELDNIQGAFAAQAAARVKSVGEDTKARAYYAKGQLPPAHLHARARRYTVKIFLSHLHHVMYVDYFGKEPPVPYVFEHCDGDHRHFIPIPNYPWESLHGKGLVELKEGERSAAKRPGPEEIDQLAIEEDLGDAS